VAAARLDFEAPDVARFPALGLARAAAEAGGTAPAALNAADETAVRAFLAGKIGFTTIVSWIEEALGAHAARPIVSLDDVFEADRWTREFLARRHREALFT
jgi:1-deoxy-D-xylulose-5-phosphate reductoisomerase